MSVAVRRSRVAAGDACAAALRRAAAARAVRAHPVVPEEVPVLRLQFARGRAATPEAERYVDALLADLEFALPSIWGRKVVSVFIGGGTPSLFPAAAIDALLAGIRARVPLLPDAEVTLEANPGTFERESFAGFRAAGVNRLSLGIQSFDDAQLAALGRVHDARRGAARGRGGAGDLRQRQPRPHVRAAGADGARRRAPTSRRRSRSRRRTCRSTS